LIFVKEKIRKFKDISNLNILADAIEEIENPHSTLCEGDVPHDLPKTIEPINFDISMATLATEAFYLNDYLGINLTTTTTKL
jgi:hypothetical protein